MYIHIIGGMSCLFTKKNLLSYFIFKKPAPRQGKLLFNAIPLVYFC